MNLYSSKPPSLWWCAAASLEIHRNKGTSLLCGLMEMSTVTTKSPLLQRCHRASSPSRYIHGKADPLEKQEAKTIHSETERFSDFQSTPSCLQRLGKASKKETGLLRWERQLWRLSPSFTFSSSEQGIGCSLHEKLVPNTILWVPPTTKDRPIFL